MGSYRIILYAMACDGGNFRAFSWPRDDNDDNVPRSRQNRTSLSSRYSELTFLVMPRYTARSSYMSTSEAGVVLAANECPYLHFRNLETHSLQHILHSWVRSSFISWLKSQIKTREFICQELFLWFALKHLSVRPSSTIRAGSGPI